MKSKVGFTLIEILIVMVIISIVAGVAAVTISSNQHKQYENLAAELTNLFTLAQEEAMLRPATLGFAITDSSFQFYLYQRDLKTNKFIWQPISQKTLGLHTLPRDTTLTLNMNGENIPADGQPHVIITPSGDVTPFILQIGKNPQNPYYQVIVKANGEISNEIFHAE